MNLKTTEIDKLEAELWSEISSLTQQRDEAISKFESTEENRVNSVAEIEQRY